MLPTDTAPPLRILFLAPDVRLSEQDGQSVHTLGLCKGLSDAGSDVLLLVADAYQTHPLPDGVEAAAIRNIGRPSLHDALQWALRWHPDVIYERRSTPRLGAQLSANLRIPYFLEINGLADMESDRRATISRAKRQLRRRYFQACTRVFVPTARLGEVLSTSYGIPHERIVVVPNGVDLSRFQPTDKSKARTALGWKDYWKTVVFVGKLVPWQGLDCLVRATRRLSEIRNLKVFIIGDGPQTESLRAMTQTEVLQDYVTLVGSVQHAEIPTWIGASDLCVAPFSRERNELIEISPIKIFEYMAMARPVVTTDVPGIRGLVGRAGVVVAPDSPDALAAAIIELLSDPDRMERLGEEGYVAAQRCSWRERATRVLQVLHPYRGQVKRRAS